MRIGALMKKVVLALVLVTSLGLFGCAGGDHASGSGFCGKIEVSVVDKSYESESGSSFPERKSIEEYQYDEQGKLVLVERSSVNEDDELEASSRQSFEYDDAGNVTQISTAYQYINWNAGNAETFSYDDSGKCTEYSYEILSQGVGKRTATYDYSDSGQIVSGVVVEYLHGAANGGKSSSMSWEYLPDGEIESTIARTTPSAGLDFISGLSDVDAGVYVYRDHYGTLSTLRFDDKGRLLSIESQTGENCKEICYEYKTIEVDASTYKPTVFSNPTGIGPVWKPALSDEEIAAIMGKKK